MFQRCRKHETESLFFILLAFLVTHGLFEHYRPKPLVWDATYKNTDKILFGTLALFELLPSAMQQSAIASVRIFLYNYLTENKLTTSSNFIFITRSIDFDANDRRKLLAYVRRGNNVLLSAYEFPDSLGQLLGFRALVKTPKLRDTLLINNFTNPRFRKPGGYSFSTMMAGIIWSQKTPKIRSCWVVMPVTSQCIFRLNTAKDIFYPQFAAGVHQFLCAEP